MRVRPRWPSLPRPGALGGGVKSRYGTISPLQRHFSCRSLRGTPRTDPWGDRARNVHRSGRRQAARSRRRRAAGSTSRCSPPTSSRAARRAAGGEEQTVAYLDRAVPQARASSPATPTARSFRTCPWSASRRRRTSQLTLRKGDETDCSITATTWSRGRARRRSSVRSTTRSSSSSATAWSAPEYGWDDYKGVDVRGKTLVMLVNDPAVPDPARPSQLDPKMFGGRAMTYYGRWTYKYEIAAEKGAAAASSSTRPGRRATRSRSSRQAGGENFDLARPTRTGPRRRSRAGSRSTRRSSPLRDGGQDFDALKKAAVTRDFRPVPLGVKASIAITNTLRDVDSQNVVAKLEGSDPTLKDEYVIYTAHWDHLGTANPSNGDRSTTAPLDNASGVATLLEIARGVHPGCRRPEALDPLPRRHGRGEGPARVEVLRRRTRSTRSPRPWPTSTWTASNMWGRTRDIIIVGLGASDLDDYSRDAAEERGRTVCPRPRAGEGLLLPLRPLRVRQGRRPGARPRQGDDYVGKPAGYGKMVRDRYTTQDYHRPPTK